MQVWQSILLLFTVDIATMLLMSLNFELRDRRALMQLQMHSYSVLFL